MSSTSSIVELINNAFIDARTAEGKRVTFALSELDGIIGATAALFDANDNVIDMRTWQLPLPNVTAERAEAFATNRAGLHATPQGINALLMPCNTG